MKAVIIEDETAAAVNLQSILHRVAPAVEITAVLEGCLLYTSRCV